MSILTYIDLFREVLSVTGQRQRDPPGDCWGEAVYNLTPRCSYSWALNRFSHQIHIEEQWRDVKQEALNRYWQELKAYIWNFDYHDIICKNIKVTERPVLFLRGGNS